MSVFDSGSTIVLNDGSGQTLTTSAAVSSAADGTVTVASSGGNSLVISSSQWTSGWGGSAGSGNTYSTPATTTYTVPWLPSPEPPPPADKLKSQPKETGPTCHSVNGILRIYGDSVVVEYYCNHCQEVLHRQVISKVPKSIIDKKCLPRIVEGV